MNHQSPIRFDAFMQQALHDPKRGYYARKIQSVGADGDFSTTATLSPTLGKAIAAWANTWRKANGGVLNLIEIGAGDGSLARAVLSQLPLLTRWKTRYHIVDTSAPLREKQREALANYKVTWHDTPTAALHACKGRALIFSNELVDAFPVRVFKRTPDLWHELFLDGMKETFSPNDELPKSTAFSSKHPENHRIEVHDSYQAWLRVWLPHWLEGEMLTVDYGDSYPALYHRRPHGTVRAYLLHQRIEGLGVYENVGRQDITADVNFSDLMQWGDELGLETQLYQTQAEFLAPYLRPTQQDSFLTDQLGAGDAFKVLIQKR